MSPETKDPFYKEKTGTTDPFSHDSYSHVDEMSYSDLQTYGKAVEEEYNVDIKLNCSESKLRARIKEVLVGGRQEVVESESNGNDVESDGEE